MTPASVAVEEVLLLLKILFLVLLYLFIWRIVRSATRDLRLPQESFILKPERGRTTALGALPSTGRLVVFRQNFIRVRQTSDRVDVPRSGPLTITTAPQGKSAQTKAQRDGALQFKGANGTTGTLHLSDDRVTVASS